MKFSKAAFIGSGVIGHGISQFLAQRGIQVNLVDTEDTILELAKGGSATISPI